MKRTTIYLEPDLESRLKRETRRQNRPMAELIRDALRQYVGDEPARQPPGAGAFASGRTDTGADTAAALTKSGFGKRR
jgi:predicted transcriptional regulator